MAEKNKLFYYRGFPLIRCGSTIFYGSGGDSYATKLTIKGTKKIADREVPDKIMVQMIPASGGDMAKARKGEYSDFYEALNTAHIWLSEVLFDQ